MLSLPRSFSLLLSLSLSPSLPLSISPSLSLHRRPRPHVAKLRECTHALSPTCVRLRGAGGGVGGNAISYPPNLTRSSPGAGIAKRYQSYPLVSFSKQEHFHGHERYPELTSVVMYVEWQSTFYFYCPCGRYEIMCSFIIRFPQFNLNHKINRSLKQSSRQIPGTALHIYVIKLYYLIS